MRDETLKDEKHHDIVDKSTSEQQYFGLCFGL